MEAKFNLWIENNQAVVLSRWRAGLLRAIDEGGSIALAAKAMNVSERTARKKLREIETGLGFAVVEPAPGAADGRTRQLTARGRKLLGQFDAFSAGFEKEVVRRYKAAFRR